MSEIYNAILESSAEVPGGPGDPMLLTAKLSPTPKNSGAQNAFPKIIRAMNRAKRMRPPFRKYAMEMAKEWLYGYAAIGGENGMVLRELNTQRSSQTLMTPNTGQKAGPWDRYFYGDHVKNNPQTNQDDLGF